MSARPFFLQREGRSLHVEMVERKRRVRKTDERRGQESSDWIVWRSGIAVLGAHKESSRVVLQKVKASEVGTMIGRAPAIDGACAKYLCLGKASETMATQPRSRICQTEGLTDKQEQQDNLGWPSTSKRWRHP